jgi:SAM-dependent methyltransferase
VATIEPGSLAQHPAVLSGAVLDVRPAACFEAGHLAGSCSWPLTGARADLSDPVSGTLEEHLVRELPSILLPARHEPLLVVAETIALARRVAEHLHARGRAWTDACAIAAADRLAPPLLARGTESRPLWRPPPFLARWVHLLPPPTRGPVLDLGCGSGRAAVWLARRGWQVTAVDHQDDALTLGRELAATEGVTVQWVQADLRQKDGLPAGPWAAALMFRFLDRGLVARLPDQLGPGGVVMLQTFRHAPGYLGNPRPRHRLARGEAAGFWPDSGARILVHEETYDADGRPAAGVVASWSA